MSRNLIPYNEIEVFSSAAAELKTLLKREDNEDITIDFPGTFKNHTADLPHVIHHMDMAKRIYGAGQHEQFIVTSGSKAVGICVITCTVPPPATELIGVPNVSGFILNPHRGQGLGRFSLEERMHIVEKNFGNKAWTFVRKDNQPSNHLIQSVGFIESSHDLPEMDNSRLYTFGL
jgi:L-amino acid N-acyltransferase YncA